MACGDAGRDVGPRREHVEDLAPGEDEHREVVARDEAEQQEEDQIAREDEQPAHEHLAGVAHADEELRDERREEHDRDAVEARDRAEDDGARVAVDGGHVERHDEVVLPVGGGIERAAEQIEDDQRVFLQDREDACAVLLFLIRRLLAAVLDGRDVPDEHGDEHRRDRDGGAADEEAQPQVILEEQPRNGRREDKAQVAAEIFERIGALAVLRRGQIGKERVVRGVFHALKDAADDEEEDRAHPQRDRGADVEADDADAVADHDHPFFVDAVGQLSAEDAGGQHDDARADEVI